MFKNFKKILFRWGLKKPETLNFYCYIYSAWQGRDQFLYLIWNYLILRNFFYNFYFILSSSTFPSHFSNWKIPHFNLLFLYIWQHWTNRLLISFVVPLFHTSVYYIYTARLIRYGQSCRRVGQNWYWSTDVLFLYTTIRLLYIVESVESTIRVRPYSDGIPL